MEYLVLHRAKKTDFWEVAADKMTLPDAVGDSAPRGEYLIIEYGEDHFKFIDHFNLTWNKERIA